MGIKLFVLIGVLERLNIRDGILAKVYLTRSFIVSVYEIYLGISSTL